MSRIDHKAGDTFEWQATYTDAEGAPIALPTGSVSSVVSTRDGSVSTPLAVTYEDQVARPGQYRLRAEAAATALWPEQILQWDIKYTVAGNVTRTETFAVQVLPPVTP